VLLIAKLLNFFLFSPFGDSIPKYRVFREGQPWVSGGRKLSKLDDFCDTVREIASQSEDSDRYIAVDDILVSTDTSMIVLGKKEIMLGPVGSAMFGMLALHAGQVVSRDRMWRSVSETLLDSHNFNGHIHKLRLKLGEAGKRIETVPGGGYMYVSPVRTAEPRTEVISQWRL
jgi:DNA-binding response OmpR family regulator